MKNKLLAIAILLFGCGSIFSSCTDMSEVVYSQIISENFIPTETDVVSIMGPAYMQMQSVLFSWTGQYDLYEECTDELVTPERPNGWVDGGTYMNLHLHQWNSEQGQLAGIWSRCYSGISSCNRIIYQLEQGTLPVPEGTLDQYMAEMRAMRVMYYFYVYDCFRNIPIQTRYDVESDYLPEQSNAQQVFDFMVTELTESIPNLSEEVGAITWGRLNKWGAYSLLARLYLNAEVYIGTPKYNECIAACEAVIASAKYSLHENYYNLFYWDNDIANPEVIYAVPFDGVYHDGDGYGWFHFYEKTLHPQSQKTYETESDMWGGSAAIPQFINTFDENDDRLKWSINGGMGPQYEYNGVTPLYCSMVSTRAEEQLVYSNVVNGVGLCPEDQGYRPLKYDVEHEAKRCLDNDFVIFRYADILMMKAECLMRTNQAGAGALVTEVRTRAFTSAPEKAAVTDAELKEGGCYRYGTWDTNQGIDNRIAEGVKNDVQYGRFLDELGWEFAFEGRRRTDLIRFGVFGTKSWLSLNQDDAVISGATANIFPIPESQLVNNPNLTQNPGY